MENTAVHLFAGGFAGTVGAVLTCPLEVVKTRLQSSVVSFGSGVCVTKVSYTPTHTLSAVHFTTYLTRGSNVPQTIITSAMPPKSMSIYMHLRHIVLTEGARALFKGLGPNLVGIAPSRAIYFCSYAQAKHWLCEECINETPRVHLLSAAFAGFAASTCTNPIWFIKTRLQLDQKRYGDNLTVRQCVRRVYNERGIRGFYKGISASYYGIAETGIHFVIYEAIKARLLEMRGSTNFDQRSASDFLVFMAAAACSKTTATSLAYPHEVARTRLRQEGTRYRSFWQTLALVVREEGYQGLYRGLATQLVRQIPATAVTMATYEGIVHLCLHYGVVH